MGSSRSISGISVPLTTNLSGWGKGLAQASTSVDRFYANVGKTLAATPFGKATRNVIDFGKGFSALATSAVKPLKPIADGIAKIGKEAANGAVLVGKLSAGFAGLALAGVAAGAVIATGGLKRIGEIGDQALTLGIAADKLTELQYAAIATGQSAETLNGFLKDLTSTVHDSIGKITPASDAFKKLGTSAEALNKLTPDQQFAALKKGFEALPDQASKAAAAVAIGGESGLKLLKLLGMGAREFEALKQQSKDAGFTVSNEDVAKVQAANAALAKIGSVIEAIGNQLAITLAPAIQVVADKFTKWFTSVFSAKATFNSVLLGFVTGLGGIADTAVSIGITFKEVFAKITTYIGDAIQSVGKLISSMGKVIPGLADVGKSIEETGKGISNFGKKAGESAKESRDAFNKNKPSTTILKTFNEFTQATEKQAKATAAATVATQAAATANKPLIDGVAKLKQEFNENINNAGFTAEIKQMKALKGITIEDQAELTRLGNLSREAGKRDALAEDLRESTKLPFEKLQEDLQRIDQLVKEGKITQAQAIRGAAAKTADSGLGAAPKLAGAVNANSIEGRSFVLSQMGRPNSAVELARQGLALTGQTNNYLGQLVGFEKNRRPDQTVSTTI